MVPPNLSPVPYRHRVVDVEPGDPPGSRSGFTAPACGGEGPAAASSSGSALGSPCSARSLPGWGSSHPGTRKHKANGRVIAARLENSGAQYSLWNCWACTAVRLSFCPHLLPPVPFVDVNSLRNILHPEFRLRFSFWKAPCATITTRCGKDSKQVMRWGFGGRTLPAPLEMRTPPLLAGEACTNFHRWLAATVCHGKEGCSRGKPPVFETWNKEKQ